MVKLKSGRKGEGFPFSFSGKGLIAIFLIAILAFAYTKGAKPAVAVAKTLDRTLEEYGLNLASFSEIVTLEPSVPPSGNYEKALVASWTLNKDGETEMSKAGADYKAEFLYRKYPDDPLEDICISLISFRISTS